MAQDDEMRARREVLERMVVQTKEAAEKEGAMPTIKNHENQTLNSFAKESGRQIGCGTDC